MTTKLHNGAYHAAHQVVKQDGIALRTLHKIALGIVVVAFTASSAHAHHSTSKYDTGTAITVEGVVKKYEWANPHVYIFVSQRTEGGETVEWEIEGNPPSVLRRQGWSRDTLHVGDSVVVTGRPAKNPDDKSLFPTTIKRGDKTLYDGAGSFQRLLTAGPAPNVAANSLEGIWATLLDAQLVPKLATSRNLPLTEKGAAAVNSFDERTMNPAINCVPFPAPISMITPDNKRISVGDGVVRIVTEFDGGERVVHLNVSTHEGASPSIQGHSIGRWDGKNLVIDTANFADHAMGNGGKLPSGSQKHLIERLTLNEDGKSLTYHLELMDPEYLSAPVTSDVTWVYRPDLEFAPEKCDPENARRFIEN